MSSSKTIGAFAYHRAVAPMMWVFVGIASVELVVTHLLVALWKPWVAIALSLTSLAGVVWLVRLLFSLKRLPVLIEDDRLVMRVGTLKRIDVPRDRVAGLRAVWDAGTFKRGEAVKLSLIAWPNVVVDLTEPVPGWRRPVRGIGHRLDDPAAFTAALEEWLASGAQRRRREMEAIA